jgi:hypothetical protein
MKIEIIKLKDKIMSQGFQLTDNQLWISKDPSARLFYTFDWSEWLASNDSLSIAEYDIAARINDPLPLALESSGIDGKKTYIELSGGQVGKSYTVSVTVTTSDGLIDRRSFKVRVENRSA